MRADASVSYIFTGSGASLTLIVHNRIDSMHQRVKLFESLPSS